MLQLTLIAPRPFPRPGSAVPHGMFMTEHQAPPHQHGPHRGLHAAESELPATSPHTLRVTVPLSPSENLALHVPRLSWRQTQLVAQTVPLCSATSPCVRPGQSLTPREGRRCLSGHRGPCRPSCSKAFCFYDGTPQSLSPSIPFSSL